MTSVNMTKQSMRMEMEIPGISKLDATWSTEISFHGVAWRVKICKQQAGGNQQLAAFLYCLSKYPSPMAAMVSFKLISFTDSTKPIEIYKEPSIFENCEAYIGVILGKWNDLIGENSKYVKDDTINLEIEVTAENPNSLNRSCLKIDRIQKCCNNSISATFRITVSNIANLIAVQTSEFTLRGLPWTIKISKSRSSNLIVSLLLNQNPEDKIAKMAMYIRLLSAKTEVRPIEMYESKQYQYQKYFNNKSFIPWNDLMKPENGFVNDNIIKLDIVVHSDEPDDLLTAMWAKLDHGTDANV